VCINKRLTYFTNYVLTSKHECKVNMCAFDLDRPSRLANCKLYIGFCSKHPQINIFPTKILFCSKRSHNRSKTSSASVNYVLKPVLQVQNRSVLISYGVYQASTISKNCKCGKTNYVHSKHRSIFICVSKQAKINLKCTYL